MKTAQGQINHVKDTDEENELFQIAIKSRVYHADLYAAAQKMGGVQLLADHLGISSSLLSSWIRLNKFPSLETVKKNGSVRKNKKLSRKWPGIVRKLFALTGKSVKELFPDFVRLSGIFEAKKEITKIQEVSSGLMLDFQKTKPLALTYDERPMSREGVAESLKAAMNELRPRERLVLELRYGLGEDEHSLRQVGHAIRVGKERVRQIEQRALGKLYRSGKALGPDLETIDFHECPKCKNWFSSFVHCESCTHVLCGDCMAEHRKSHRPKDNLPVEPGEQK